MLKGIAKTISPELLKVLSEMGHGDEIVFADGNFPAESMGQRVVRLDGIGMMDILPGVLKLFPLDTYASENAVLMEVVKGDTVVPVIWDKYKKTLEKDSGCKLTQIERFAFYERAQKAYAVVATGEGALYANIILKKGVVV